jgi:SAM-dependent methyltransferase
VPDEFDVEFGTVAGWTADAVEELGDEYGIVAGCRGSGDPGLLEWLATACGVGAGSALIDVGAGVGGAAAWAVDRYGVRPVLVEPMEEACRAARRIFGHPVVCAAGDRLPFGAETFPAAWCIGVLCTVHDKSALLREIRRVLKPGGSLGMMVLVAEPDLHSEAPRGNEFPRRAELSGLIERAGFVLRELIDAPDAEPPADWQARADCVDEVLGKRHGDDPRWQEAEEQSRKLGHLLTTGQVTRQLVHAVRR